jgi:hypothetical protein
MLVPHPVIPLLESNAMVIDRSISVDCAIEVSIPLVFVELKLQGFHASHSGQKWVAIV